MLTKEQWKEIEETLTLPYANVKLRCDGHEVAAIVQISKNKLIVEVYIDGWLKGEWMDIKNEFGRKFYPQKTKFFLNPQERKEALKNANNKRLSKDLREFYKKHYDEKFSYLMPYFTNAKLFCRHIRKTCQSIELV